MAMSRVDTTGQSPATHATGSRERLRLVVYLVLVSADLAVIVGSFAIPAWTQFGNVRAGPPMKLSVASAIAYAVYVLNDQLYSIAAITTTRNAMFRSVISLITVAGTVTMLGFLLRATSERSQRVITIAYLLSLASVILVRLLFTAWTRYVLQGRLNGEVVILAGPSIPLSAGSYVVDAAQENLASDANDPHMPHRLSSLMQFGDRVIVVCHQGSEERYAACLKGLDVRAEIISPSLALLGSLAIGQSARQPTLVVGTSPLSVPNRLLKRALELSIKLPVVVLLLLLPWMVLVAVAIKIDSPGPVLFKQQRMGRGNRLFQMLKFRSMRVEGTDATGDKSAARDDDRITRVGKIIRATSIDELPQLLNVLRGKMSLVGPRPHALGSRVDDALFWQVDPQYWHRHRAKPGMTGLAQVRGHRGATEQVSDLTLRVQADLESLTDWTIGRDITILVRTFGVMARRNAF